MTWEIYACNECGMLEPENHILNDGTRVCEHCGSELSLKLVDSSEMRERK